MARLNLANPTVVRGRQSPATKNLAPRSTKPTRITKSSTEFTIFEDEVSEEVVDQVSESFSSRATTQTVRQALPLKLAHINSITVGLSRASKVGSLTSEESDEESSDKENILLEEEAEEVSEEEDEDRPEEEELDVFAEHENFNSLESVAKKSLQLSGFGGHREPSPKDESDSDSEEERQSDDDGSESLDGFIVSDGEDISYLESADELPDDDEQAADHPVIVEPSPKPARKKLLRGRKLRYSLATRTDDKETKDDDPFLDTSNECPYTKCPSIKSPTNILSTFRRLSIKNQEEDGPMEKTRSNKKSPLREVPVSRTVTTDSPAKKIQTKKLETPPPSPSKVPLPSPSKTNYRIPRSPHRESSDEFWSQQVTNSWNDQWSPQKPRTPGRALQRLLVALGGDVDDDEDTSRPSSPTEQKAQKSPSKTALKKAEIARKKEIMAQKKAFDDKKASLGEDFLRALDDAVCDGQVQKMTECTGGIKTIWSKTLQTTAGRANWKQEKITKPGQPTRFVHHASIELAERIIDSEDRLLNTLAHEYCHLANFIISKVKTNPHGASFKEWGRKCTEAVRRHPIYKHYPVEVSTKHSYKIDYKYVWLCVDCGKDYGRHSKSIDPSKSKCGVCKGALQQIKPKPRNVSPKKSPCHEAGQKDIDDVTRAVGRVSLAPV